MKEVYLAEQSRELYPQVIAELQNHVQVGFLSGGGDEWARDYMPVPTCPGEAVQFQFDPPYLKPRQFQHLHTNVAILKYPTELSVTSHAIVLDGGNVVSDGKLAILTEQVRMDNPGLQQEALLSELTRVLRVEQVVLIPWLPGDWTRHADGMAALVEGWHWFRISAVKAPPFNGTFSGRWGEFHIPKWCCRRTPILATPPLGCT